MSQFSSPVTAYTPRRIGGFVATGPRTAPVVPGQAPMGQGGVMSTGYAQQPNISSPSMPPLAPNGYNPRVSAQLDQATQDNLRNLSNQKFNQWYGNLHPNDAAQFAPPIQTPYATSTQGYGTLTNKQGMTQSYTNTPAENAAMDAARQRQNARLHFEQNVLPTDSDYMQAHAAAQLQHGARQAGMSPAEYSAYSTGSMPPLNPAVMNDPRVAAQLVRNQGTLAVANATGQNRLQVAGVTGQYRSDIATGQNKSRETIAQGQNTTRETIAQGNNTTKEGIAAGQNATKEQIAADKNKSQEGIAAAKLTDKQRSDTLRQANTATKAHLAGFDRRVSSMEANLRAAQAIGDQKMVEANAAALKQATEARDSAYRDAAKIPAGEVPYNPNKHNVEGTRGTDRNGQAIVFQGGKWVPVQ